MKINRVPSNTRSLNGVLASNKGKGKSFAKIREAAATRAKGDHDSGKLATGRSGLRTRD